jgi:hypothetical protein
MEQPRSCAQAEGLEGDTVERPFRSRYLGTMPTIAASAATTRRTGGIVVPADREDVEADVVCAPRDLDDRVDVGGAGRSLERRPGRGEPERDMSARSELSHQSRPGVGGESPLPVRRG